MFSCHTTPAAAAEFLAQLAELFKCCLCMPVCLYRCKPGGRAQIITAAQRDL